MTTAIIIQARMTSSRLPGKVLKEVGHKSLLSYQIERLRRASLADVIVLATTTNATDAPLIDFCEKEKIQFFRGSEDDVLSRYYGAAIQCGAKTIVRITSDCPIIDPAVVDTVISTFISNKNKFDYVSNTQTRTYPRGMDTEVFSFEALSTAHNEATLSTDREHVTPFIYRQPQRFQLGQVIRSKDSKDESQNRWTVDTQEDYTLISRIIESLYPTNPGFTMEDVLDLLQKNPEWRELNRHIEQKKT